MNAAELWVPCQTFTWNGERKMNRFERAALVREARQAAYWVAVDWLRRGGQRFDVPVWVTFAPVQASRGGMADTGGHGPSCKAVLDGLVDAKVIPADDPRWVRAQTYVPPSRSAQTGVRVMLRAADVP